MSFLGLLGFVPSSFVQDAPLTLAQLHSLYPPNAGNQFMYARVSDLFSEAPVGQRGGVVVNDTGSNWRPQRADRYLNAASAAGGTLTFSPLITPPSIRITGASLATAMAINFNTLYAYASMKTLIKRDVGGIAGITLSGLGVSLGALNSWALLEWDGTQNQIMQSSGLV